MGDRARTLDQVGELLVTQGAGLLRQLFQDHLDACAARERSAYRADPAPLVGADGVARSKVEMATGQLVTRFGQVTVSRLSYRSPGAVSLRPADVSVNLPSGVYSYVLQRLLCTFATEVSFDSAIDFVERATDGPRLRSPRTSNMIVLHGRCRPSTPSAATVQCFTPAWNFAAQYAL